MSAVKQISNWKYRNNAGGALWTPLTSAEVSGVLMGNLALHAMLFSSLKMMESKMEALNTNVNRVLNQNFYLNYLLTFWDL